MILKHAPQYFICRPLSKSHNFQTESSTTCGFLHLLRKHYSLVCLSAYLAERLRQVPKIHKDVLIKEVERLCKLEILEEQHTSKWASSSFKTDKSKRKGVCFGGNVLTDKKSAQLVFRSIFNPTHYSLPFCLDFLADRTALVKKCCGWKLGWSDLSIPCQKLPCKVL
jgi:hypothetical protein